MLVTCWHSYMTTSWLYTFQYFIQTSISSCGFTKLDSQATECPDCSKQANQGCGLSCNPQSWYRLLDHWFNPISRLSGMLAEAPALQGTEGSGELATAGDDTPTCSSLSRSTEKTIAAKPQCPRGKDMPTTFCKASFQDSGSIPFGLTQILLMSNRILTVPHTLTWSLCFCTCQPIPRTVEWLCKHQAKTSLLGQE